MSKGKRKPIVILRPNGYISQMAIDSTVKAARRFNETGILLAAKGVDVLVFDDRGRLAYPIPPYPQK